MPPPFKVYSKYMYLFNNLLTIHTRPLHLDWFTGDTIYTTVAKLSSLNIIKTFLKSDNQVKTSQIPNMGSAEIYHRKVQIIFI